MWAGLFDINTFKKLFADPMDAVLGLSIVPVSVPSAGAQNVTIGNVSTGVSMTKASSQYVTVDCGTVDITEYWGSYLDYDPYTKIELFLPYIGTRQIATDDVMGKSIQIKYNVDILSGSCTACVMCGNSVLYSFEGQCSCNIPITGNDWSSTISSAITAATAIGSVVATSGASAPLAAGEAAKATKDVGKYISVGGSVASSAANVSKPNIAKSGSVSSMSGMLGIQKPYFIITRPRHAVPGNQNQYQGYPAFITKYLGSLSGYTEIDSIILNYVSASDTEEAEIIKLLQGGVIL